MELPGELVAGEEQPQCVSRSKENRRVRKRRQSRPEAAAATIPNATGCCQSIHAQDTPQVVARNREFFTESESRSGRVVSRFVLIVCKLQLPSHSPNMRMRTALLL